MLRLSISASPDLDALRIGTRIKFAVHLQTGLRRGCGDQFDHDEPEAAISGLPRQVWVMWQRTRRCSIFVPFVCLAKAHRCIVGANPHPATLSAPAGSARSGSGGDEWSEAPSGKGPFYGDQAGPACKGRSTSQH